MHNKKEVSLFDLEHKSPYGELISNLVFRVEVS